MRAALPVLGAVPHAFLGRVIIGDGESFELLKLKGASAIILNEALGHTGELKPLANKQSTYSKTSGYLLDAQSGRNHIAKGDELVSRVHRDSDRVLGQASFKRSGGIDEFARDVKGLRDLLFARKTFESPETSTSRNDFIFA